MSRTLKWSTAVSLALGVALAVLGIWGDRSGFWTDRAFLTNLVSSFTGLCVGIPFALIVLSRLNAQQAEALARAASLKRAKAEAEGFREAVLAGFKQQGTDDIRRGLQNVIAKCSALYRDTPLGVIGHPGATRKQQVDEAVAAVFAYSGREQQREWLHELLYRLQNLEAVLNPYLREAGLKPGDLVGLRRAVHKLDGLDPHPFARLGLMDRDADAMRANQSTRSAAAHLQEIVEGLRVLSRISA